MRAGSKCRCLVCRVERQFIAEMESESAWREAPIHVDLRAFANPLDLVRALHAAGNPANIERSERLLRALVGENARASCGSFWQRLLLLAFIPAIHRTTSQVRMAFPSLAEDDVCQHAMAVLLEFLASKELQTLSSHLAFTVARRIRRGVFRWAIGESRLAAPEEIQESSFEEPAGRETAEAATILGYFLDTCQRAGWLSREERQLLMQSKIQGLSYGELAMRNGHSAVAIQHRLQRVLERLRRVAKKSPPRQLELFERS